MAEERVVVSNGTGLDLAMWHCGCHMCIHYKAFQEALAAENGDPPEGCPILQRIATEGDNSPPEWTIGDDGYPQCSQFVLDEGDTNHYKAPDHACADLFDQTTRDEREPVEETC